MRRKPSYDNLGLRHEAYIVCSKRNRDFFTRVAAHMEAHGVMTGLMCYDVQEDFTARVKKHLRRSYHVLFMLEQGVVEESVQCPPNQPNLFLQIYGYVNRTNPFSISCVAVNHCHVQQDLTYPNEMRGFEGLHRMPYSTFNAQAVADDLHMQLRRLFPLSRRDLLENLNQNGLTQHAAYYDKARSTSFYGLLGCLFMLLVLLFGPGRITNDQVLLFLGTMCGFMLAILVVMICSAVLKAQKSSLLLSYASRAGMEDSTRKNKVKKGFYFLSFFLQSFWLLVLFAFVMVIQEGLALPVGWVVILGYLMYDASVYLECLCMKKQLGCANYLTASRKFLTFRSVSRKIRIPVLVLLSIGVIVLYAAGAFVNI